MMSQVQQKQLSHSPEDYSNDNNYDYGDAYGSELGEDSSTEGYDPTMDQESPPPTEYSATELRSQLSHLNELLKTTKDVQGRDKITAEIKSLGKKIDVAVGISNEKKQATEFSSILAVISHVEAEILGKPEGPAGNGLEGDQGNSGIDSKQLKQDLQKAIDDIKKRKNLTDDEKVELRTPLEKDLNQIDIAKGDLSKLDPNQIQGDIEEAKKNADEQDAYSPALKSLAKATDLDPEAIKAKAEAAGIDFNKLQNPPSSEELKKVLDFLVKNVPSLKDQFKAVEDAINARNQNYEKIHTTAQSISDANHASTTDQDNTDLNSWQQLYNYQFHQDDDSIKVTKAMNEAMGSLEPLLQAIYGEQSVKQVEVNGVSGWQKQDQEYKVADQISIGGTTFDLFNNTTGKLQTSTTPDQEQILGIPTIWHDGEGDGEWDPSATVTGMNTYGSAKPSVQVYDDSDSNPFW